jgi:hypothetical protein
VVARDFGTATESSRLDVIPARRNLTNSEQALLTIIAAATQVIGMADFGLTATEAAAPPVLIYFALRAALRCLDTSFLGDGD